MADSATVMSVVENETERRVSNLLSKVKKTAEDELRLYEEFLAAIEEKVQKAKKKVREQATANLKLLEQKLQIPPSTWKGLLNGIPICLDNLEQQLQSEQWLRVSPHYQVLLDDELFADFKINLEDFEDLLLLFQKLKQFSKKPECNLQCDPFLVTVNYIVDVNEFYVQKVGDAAKKIWLQDTLNEITFTAPSVIAVNSIYGVQVANSKGWLRGQCRKQCGYMHIGDQPPQALYEFFLLDEGRCEKISTACISELPEELIQIEPVVTACRLNEFPPEYSTAETVNLFRQHTNGYPFKMEIFSSNCKIQKVDLFPIPKTGEEMVVSIRSSLLAMWKQEQEVANYPSKMLTIKRGTCLQGTVINFHQPDRIYIEFDGSSEEKKSFMLMMKQLQAESNVVNAHRNQGVQTLQKGQPYAVRFRDGWNRVLFEKLLPGGRALVYSVDTGLQSVVYASSVRILHEKFVRFPSRSIRCRLDHIMKNGQKHPLPQCCELITQGLIKSRVTVFVEGMERTCSHSSRWITAFQQELDIFLVLELMDEEIRVNAELDRRLKPEEAGVKVTDEKEKNNSDSIVRERRLSISDFFQSAPNSYL